MTCVNRTWRTDVMEGFSGLRLEGAKEKHDVCLKEGHERAVLLKGHEGASWMVGHERASL